VKKRCLWIIALIFCLLLTACGEEPLPTPPPATVNAVQTEPAETVPETTLPEETEPAETMPEHSSLYLPDIPVEDVILYFNEVVLDSEFINSGDPSYVQKWTTPIHIMIEGDPTDADLAVLYSFTDWLNNVEGFPGIGFTEDPVVRNLRLYFCDQQEMVALMGAQFESMDGSVTFWYDSDEIYDAIICVRSDLDQQLRNSVILEEIYNGLGPIQDTALRPDSIIWKEFSQPQWLTPMDELLLRLLYHPDILPGMDAQQCGQVIRELYY